MFTTAFWLGVWAWFLAQVLKIPALALQHWGLIVAVVAAMVAVSVLPWGVRLGSLLVVIVAAALWGGKNKVTLPSVSL